MIPPWTLVLSHEHAIRKHCYKTMAQQGLLFKLVREKSWKDATLKERHFTTPLALYAKRGYTATSSVATATPGDTGGKGKTKGKGKGKKGHSRTPVNKPICFRYNSKGGCKKKAKWHFEHVCTRCFGDHHRCILGNMFADFTWEVIERAIENRGRELPRRAKGQEGREEGKARPFQGDA